VTSGEIARMVFAFVCWVSALYIILFTFLPLLNTTTWWIRVMDFPRVQIAVAGLAVLVSGIFLRGYPVL